MAHYNLVLFCGQKDPPFSRKTSDGRKNLDQNKFLRSKKVVSIPHGSYKRRKNSVIFFRTWHATTLQFIVNVYFKGLFIILLYKPLVIVLKVNYVKYSLIKK